MVVAIYPAINQGIAIMTLFELVALLVTSPVVAVLLYGAWNFSTESR